jgi:hypothetical protein
MPSCLFANASIPGKAARTLSALCRPLCAAVAASALAMTLATSASAQGTPMQCADTVQQDPTKVFRSGLWKQWFYWAIPGPSAFAAIQRIVAEANVPRAAAGLPLLVADPTLEIVVSVFDERNARGANGSSALPVTANQEAFLATFVLDTAGGFQVLFLADPMRTNDLLTAKAVPGVAANIARSMEFESENGVDKVSTEWEISSATNDKIKFSAHYPGSAVYFHGVGPASRINYANCNLTYSTDIVYRSAPTRLYQLFAREESNFLDLATKDVKVKIQVKHHDNDVNAIFNDPKNAPEVLIGTDRDVRIESR